MLGRKKSSNDSRRCRKSFGADSAAEDKRAGARAQVWKFVVRKAGLSRSCCSRKK
jgi:hypothetical protein